MQNISTDYRSSINDILRNRGYLRVLFGVPVLESQTNAVIEGDLYWLSDPSRVFKNGSDNFVYASLEKNFIKADGSKFIAPINSQGYLQEKSLISSGFVSDANYVFTVSFNGKIVNIDIIEFNFGENYPVDFDISDNNGDIFEIRNNDRNFLKIEHSFVNVNELTFTIITMINTDNRFRLYSMNFGIGLIYENDHILDSSLDYSISPINKSLPTIDFQVKLVNEDHYFDIDNPKSVLNLFNTSTKVSLFYGYQIADNRIEWVQGGELFCYDWSADDKSASISARDVLRDSNTEYIYGSIESINLYTLAEKVFRVMGISDYTIDPGLSEIFTSNPIPRVSCKEALQIIANMARRVLTLTRSGGVKIGSQFLLEYSSNGDYYDKLNSIDNQTEKTLYASLDQDLIKVDGSPVIAPIDYADCWDTGFVSNLVSGEDGFFVRVNDNVEVVEEALNNHIGVLEYILQTDSYDFNNIPKITITLNEISSIASIIINFGAGICDIIRVKGCINDTVIDTVTVTDNSDESLEVHFQNNQMNKIEIEFVKTLIPEQRVYVDWIQVLSGSNFLFTRNDMLSSPVFSKFPTIKEINVPWYVYQLSLNEEKLLEQEITVESTETVYRFLMKDPSYDYRLTVTSGTVSIVEYGNYYLDVSFSTTGTKNLIIYGKKYTVIEQVYTMALNEDGEVIKWENPLIDSREKAEALCGWLIEYYSSPGTYEYQTRGNPELDVNDAVYMEHYSKKMLPVLVTDTTLDFNGAFSGNVKVLRKGR